MTLLVDKLCSLTILVKRQTKGDFVNPALGKHVVIRIPSPVSVWELESVISNI